MSDDPDYLTAEQLEAVRERGERVEVIGARPQRRTPRQSVNALTIALGVFNVVVSDSGRTSYGVDVASAASPDAVAIT